MTDEEYARCDGLALAAMVRNGETSPLELVDAAIERIERLNPTVNAVVHKAFDEARAAASGPLPDGPFKGVPFLVKDLAIGVAGWPRTSGSRFCRDVVDADDSGLTRRYREAGVVLLGRGASSEFGIAGNVETALYGPTRNPWNPDHIAGGSSGGSAAAVAAGMVPLAHASDGLGSIRIPAACCGLVGLKPTRDRVPNLPDGFDYAMGFVVDHVVSRSVRDSAAMLDATGIPEPASPYAPPPKHGSYLSEVARSPGRLRIAWSSETPRGEPIDPQVQQALETTAETLAALGHEVRVEPLGVDYRALYAARAPVSGANFAAGMARTIAEVGREPGDDELEPLTRAAWEGARKVTGEQAFHAFQELRMLARGLLTRFESFDVYLCPVMSAPPPAIGFTDPATVPPRDINRRQAALYPYTAMFNFTGQPSISLPVAQSTEGLPIGMMFTARYGDEATLFRLAGQLEKEVPWAGRRPAIRGVSVWRNWSGSVIAEPRRIVAPRDEAELAQVVAAASQVRVTGAGHSFTPLCETDDALISLSEMAGELTTATDRQTVEAPAGWSLRRLTEALWREGLSLSNQGDIDTQSLAGALATGTHGTGRELGSLSTLAEAFRLMTASGETVECDRDTNPELFEAQRLSLGLLGVATQVRLRVLPAFHLEERIEHRPLGEVLESIEVLAAATRHVEFFLFPYADSVMLKTLHPCEAGGESKASRGDEVFQACCDLATVAPRAIPMIQRTLTRLWRSSTQSGPAWRIFPSERDVRFEEMEYEVPLANAVAALKAVVARIRAARMPLVFPLEFRLVAGDDIWLSPFHEGPCASISIHQYASMPWAEHFADLERVLQEHGGRPHWAKRHTLTAADVRKLYPRAADFDRVRQTADPAGKFMNAHTRQLFDT